MALDQLSKLWARAALASGERVDLIGDVFGFRLIHNPGGVFGLLPDAPIFFFAASLIVVLIVGGLGWRGGAPPGPLGLVLGGGLGNLLDRVINPPSPLRGEVVDFLDLSFWPTFNLADAAIVIGVVWLLIASFRTAEGGSGDRDRG